MSDKVRKVMEFLRRIGARGRNQWMITVVCVRLAKQLRMLRIERGLTKQQLAERAGLHYITISRLENRFGFGIRRASLHTICRIAAALDVALICEFVSFLDFATQLVGQPTHGCKSFDQEVADGDFREDRP